VAFNAFPRKWPTSSRSRQTDLHLAKLQRSARPCSPLRLTIVGKIAVPVICSLRILVLPLQQQPEVKHCIGVVRRDPQHCPQAFNRGFNAAAEVGAGALEGAARSIAALLVRWRIVIDEHALDREIRRLLVACIAQEQRLAAVTDEYKKRLQFATMICRSLWLIHRFA
jgi:hypothetical protein